MMYNPERTPTHPAKLVERASRRRSSMQERDTTGEVMSFSADYLPGEERGKRDTAPVYMADRYAKLPQSFSQPIRKVVTPTDGESRELGAFTREGVRLRLGVGALLAAGMLLLGIVAVSYGQISLINRDINNATERMEGVKNQCQEVERQIADSATELNIRSAAAELGMVSARSADVIYLEVPSAATYSNPGTGSLLGD